MLVLEFLPFKPLLTLYELIWLNHLWEEGQWLPQRGSLMWHLAAGAPGCPNRSRQGYDTDARREGLLD
jgi:hypothetical protein